MSKNTVWETLIRKKVSGATGICQESFQMNLEDCPPIPLIGHVNPGGVGIELVMDPRTKKELCNVANVS